MKQVFIYLVLTMAFIAAVGYFSKGRLPFSNLSQKSVTKVSEAEKYVVRFPNVDVSVEVADTESERAQGLSGRERLGDAKGMLFVFDEKDQKPTFWMKDMKFAIDIIWINDDKVSGITKNAPAPESDVPLEQLERFPSPTVVDFVLEVDAGFADKHNIEVGDNVQINI